MIEDPSKPDIPLRLLLQLFKLILISPIGALVMDAGRNLMRIDEENWLDVTRLQLVLPRLRPEFGGYRVVQISDFHIGTWANRKRLEEAVDLVNSLNPDIVAITGDLVTFTPEKYEPDLTAILQALTPRDGSVAVLGNHDHWAGPRVVRRILRNAGVKELRNTFITIQRGAASLHFAGVDDMMQRRDDLKAIQTKIPSQGAAILLAHEPDFADISAAGGRFDLQLSGHTHGGQVHFPRVGPLILPKYGRKYPCGLYHVDEMHVYTNRGLGTAELQIRYNCPAEITLFELQPPAIPALKGSHLDS